MRLSLLVWDFVCSLLWVCTGALIKTVVSGLGLGHTAIDEAVRISLSIGNMFFFAFLLRAADGAGYNPITILSSAVSSSPRNFLFTIAARIPSQVMGSVCGAMLIMRSLPGIGSGPKLNVDIYRGAITEGLLTFSISIISLSISRKSRGSFLMKTWIVSVSKLALNVLGSDLTGGCMNPASVFGWAYARGDHISKEHIVVYWIAPMIGAFMGLWTFTLLVNSAKVANDKKKFE